MIEPNPVPSRADRAALFAGGGEMGRRIAEYDWSTSPLGPIDSWPEALVNAVSLLLPTGSEIVLFWGPDYVALYNDAYAPTIGTKHPAALGRPARESWSELWDDLEALLSHVRTTGETYVAKDRPFYIERSGYGEEVYFDISYSAVRVADGAVGGVLCIVSDTTERVRSSRAVAEDRARLAEMFDSAPGFMAVLREPGHVIELTNASCNRLIGHRAVVGLPLAEALPEVAGQGFVEILDAVVDTGEPYRGEHVAVTVRRTVGGPPEERVLDFVFQPTTGTDGRVTGIFVEGTDVTERYAAEHALALSRESLSLAADAAEIGTWDLDLATDTLDWSVRTKAMFGISPDVPCSMRDFYKGLHPDDLAAITASFAAAIDPERRALYDVEYRTIGAEDGVLRWIAAKGRGIFEDGICVRAIGTTIDITARKALDDELRESEERFRQLADTAPALIWLTDAEGKVVFTNRWFQSFLGIGAEEMRENGWIRLIPPDERAEIARHRAKAWQAREAFGGELRVVDAAGRDRWVHAEGRPRFHADRFEGFIGCAVDVTESHLAADALEKRVATRTAELADANRLLTEQIAERERVEETLNQMQRLEAVGQLTAGVAHDFNNLLTVVLGNVEILQRSAARGGTLDERAAERLAHVRTAAERGAALTAQLLAFARRSRLEAKTVDLNAVVEGMRALLESSLGATVTIETRLAAELWPATVDPTQIELILLNLAINARDAMERGGVLTIETANVALGDPDRVEEPAAGDYVMVAVADSGGGMSEAVLAKAFEPFFTTKPVGKGSGLGLAQVYGFAKQSGGGVRIDTGEGEGTTVRVYLPRSGDVARNAEAIVSAPLGQATTKGRAILVVDDDDAVRSVTADSLREAGWRVVEAGDGPAGLAALAREPDLALIVADFAMPGMNGAEFAKLVQERGAGLPVLFVTGYAELGALAHVGEDRILQKPYRAADLIDRVRRALT